MNGEVKINESDLIIFQDPQYRRFESTVDIEKCILFFKNKLMHLNTSLFNENFFNKCCNEFIELLNRLNFEMKDKIQSYCESAINAIIGHVRYERVDKHGPHRGTVNNDFPLVTK